MINTIKTTVAFSRLKPTVVLAHGETPATTYGDMKKSLYDTDNDGKVDSAANADNATHANTADTAATASSATHATTADNATNANNATHATTADNAATATMATTASAATNAQQLNNQLPAYYLNRNNHTGNTPLTSIDNTSGAIGDILTWNGTAWEKLPAGQQGQVLLSSGTGQKPKWVHSEYILGKSNVEVTLTNSLSETILYSLLIPAGTVNASSNIEVIAKFIKNVGSSGVNVYIKANSTPSLVGAVTIGFFRPGSLTGYCDLRRTITMRNSLNDQIVYNNTVNNVSNDYTVTNTPHTPLSLNFSQNVFILITGVNGNVADILTLYSSLVTIT